MKGVIVSVILFVQLVSFINGAPSLDDTDNRGGIFDLEQRRRCIDAMTRGIEELTTKLNEDIQIENQKLTELLSPCNSLPIVERLRCRRELNVQITEINSEITRLRREFATNKMQILNDFYSCRVAGGSPTDSPALTTDGLELPINVDAIDNQI